MAIETSNFLVRSPNTVVGENASQSSSKATSDSIDHDIRPYPNHSSDNHSQGSSGPPTSAENDSESENRMSSQNMFDDTDDDNNVVLKNRSYDTVHFSCLSKGFACIIFPFASISSVIFSQCHFDEMEGSRSDNFVECEKENDSECHEDKEVPRCKASNDDVCYYYCLRKLLSKLPQKSMNCFRKVTGKRQRQKKLNGLLGDFDSFHYLDPAFINANAVVFPVSRHSPNQGQSENQPQKEPSGRGQQSLDKIHGRPWSAFSHELYRLGTFVDLPSNSPVFALRLAQVGFMRLEDGSIVCFFCGLRRDEWNAGESPLEVHKQLRPNCSILTKINCSNQPVDVLSAEQLERQMDIWSLSRPPDRDAIPQRAAAVEVADAAPAVPQVTPSTTQSSSLRAGRLQTVDVAEDSHHSGSGAQANIPARSEPPALAAAASSQNNSSSSNQTVCQQSPRLGLLGGASENANPGASNAARAPIFDGTAQPEPPRGSEGQSASASTPRAGQQVVTYQQLGIVTDAPKRPDMAMINARVGTFRNWPSNNSHTPLELSEAGFYYAGYADCGRCFFCGGGLKNWEPVDNPWVEHARWFPKCAYVRQCQGQDFIDIIQELNVERQPISLNQVREEIVRRRADGERLQEPVVDPAIPSALEQGYSQESVDAAVQRVQREGNLVTAARLMDSLQADGAVAAGGAEGGALPDANPTEVVELIEENNEIRQQRICKICLDKEVCIVFLPCGHLVCCAECSPALRHCPMCRQRVKGRVRAFPA